MEVMAARLSAVCSSGTPAKPSTPTSVRWPHPPVTLDSRRRTSAPRSIGTGFRKSRLGHNVEAVMHRAHGVIAAFAVPFVLRNSFEGGGPSFRTSVVVDYRASAWRRRLALAGVLAWLAYEWGPGNEAVTPWIVLRIIGSTNESAAVVPVATAVGFGFTLFQQTLSGLTALSGFSMFTQTTQSAWEYLSDD